MIQVISSFASLDSSQFAAVEVQNDVNLVDTFGILVCSLSRGRDRVPRGRNLIVSLSKEKRFWLSLEKH